MSQSAARIKENMGALEVSLSSEEVAELDAAVPADQVVGTRYPGEAVGRQLEAAWHLTPVYDCI
jgi:diketogulonate reductase-like aldo/keto reductase